MRSPDVTGGLVVGLAARLRRSGVRVSTAEVADAARAVDAVGLGDPDRVRAALRTCLIKRREEIDLFDRFFEAQRRVARPAAGEAPGLTGDVEEVTSTALLERLLQALRSEDESELSSLARLAVDEHAGMTGGARSSERAYVYRVLRRLDLSNLLQRAMRQLLDGQTEPLAQALITADAVARAEDFRRLIGAEVRRRLDTTATEEGDDLSENSIEDVGVLLATPHQLREMRRALRPLARRLASRVAERRRHLTRGRLDIRRTMRASMSTGGVAIRPWFRRPHITRPELVLLIDMSGSVAEFAGFSLALLGALSAEFTRLRSFLFVDGVDEVTAIVAQAQAPLEPGHLLARADVVAGDGHSDYGRALESFALGWPEALNPRTTIIVIGDGRSNYRPGGVEMLTRVAARVRHVHWLNPEPRTDWDTTDSTASAFARHCESMHEVSTLRQLEAAVFEIVTHPSGTASRPTGMQR